MATLLTGSNLEKLLKEDGMLVQYFNNYLNLEVSSILIQCLCFIKRNKNYRGYCKALYNILGLTRI